MLPATPQTLPGSGAAPDAEFSSLQRPDHPHPPLLAVAFATIRGRIMCMVGRSSQSLTLAARSRSDPYMTMTTRRCARLHPLPS